MTEVRKPSISFMLSLIGGLFILVGSIISLVWILLGNATFGFWGMMGGWHGWMGGFGFSYAYMATFAVVGLVCGAIVIIGALMLNARPAEHMTWGTLILIFSAVSFVGMGGWFIGALLGLIGGAFALSWKPR